MLTKKQIFLRCVSVIMGLILGIGASYLTWNIKNYFRSPDSKISKIKSDKLVNSDFWDKVTIYFEMSGQNFYDNYINIYENYDLSQKMDMKLLPYFEKYGYTSMIISGLKSKNKLATSYCVEKCCELWGENKFDKEQVLSALNSVTIDTKLMTDDENEKSYIDVANERLNLARTLLDESYSSDKIIKNRLKTKMVWIYNMMSMDKKLRIYDDELFYTTENYISSRYSPIYFASDNTLIVNDDYANYAIYINNMVCEYDIKDIIADNIEETNPYIHITNIKSSDDIVYADFTSVSLDDATPNPKRHTLEFNLKNQLIQINDKN